MNQSAAVAFLFPGQGSQSVGMLSALAAEYAVVRDTFAEGSDVLGYDLWQLAQIGPEEKQRRTEFTQPLMYASGVALWRLWSSLVPAPPAVLAGHSLGEFCALTASGVMTYRAGLELVSLRAQLMASAVAEGEGGMAAILGLDDAAVIEVCESITGERIVEAVNFNSPGQVAISGHVDALQSACAAARDRGARKAVILPVSVPNHSSLMRAAGEALAAQIDAAGLRSAEIPVMQNTHAAVPADLVTLLSSLKIHMYSPVQWAASYRALLSNYSPDVVLELGPGRVLVGLGKRIERSVAVMPVDNPDNLHAALCAVQGGQPD